MRNAALAGSRPVLIDANRGRDRLSGIEGDGILPARSSEEISGCQRVSVAVMVVAVVLVSTIALATVNQARAGADTYSSNCGNTSIYETGNTTWLPFFACELSITVPTDFIAVSSSGGIPPLVALVSASFDVTTVNSGVNSAPTTSQPPFEIPNSGLLIPQGVKAGGCTYDGTTITCLVSLGIGNFFVYAPGSTDSFTLTAIDPVITISSVSAGLSGQGSSPAPSVTVVWTNTINPARIYFVNLYSNGTPVTTDEYVLFQSPPLTFNPGTQTYTFENLEYGTGYSVQVTTSFTDRKSVV